MGFNLRRALSRTAKTILAKAAEPAVIYFSLAAAPLAAQAAQAGQAVVEEATVAAVPVGQDALVHIAEHIKVAKEAVSPYAAQAGETIVKGAKAAGDSMGPKIGEAIKSVGKRVSAAAVAIKPYTKDMHPAVPIFFGVTVAIGVIYLVYRYVVPAVLRIVGFSGKGVVAVLQQAYKRVSETSRREVCSLVHNPSQWEAFFLFLLLVPLQLQGLEV
ncbi:hypothetical protein BDP27DRAFT_485203 [Rhodocollybia butyracea]|uniref:Uncharacterized protein n=1 Tax=Rhodocollybia butyracea TaxID=206335 RepID=A0A9P5Q8W1_9AGAR|nr:hypothetical protein BDP27DRAFT_485203 [Rhodocollybia butyracea]